MYGRFLSSLLVPFSALALAEAFTVKRSYQISPQTNVNLFPRLVRPHKMESHEPLLVESQELIKRAFKDSRVVVIDVRSPIEITSKIQSQNWINAPGSPFYNEKLACRASELIPDKTVPVIVYCASGKRAHAAVDVLERQGYKNVHNAGGIDQLYFLPIVSVKGQDAEAGKIMP